MSDKFEGSPDRTHYPMPARWAKCTACGSTIWTLGREGSPAADAFEVHSAFCRKTK